MKKQLITLAVLAGGFVLGASALVALADTSWTPPTATPPNGNVPAPINVGILGSTAVQEKFDSLMIDRNLGVIGNLLVSKGASTTPGTVLTNVNGDGIASWVPAGGSGGGRCELQAGVTSGVKDTNTNVKFPTVFSAIPVVVVTSQVSTYTAIVTDITTSDFNVSPQGPTDIQWIAYNPSSCSGGGFGTPGVASIIAGNNISISPTSGTGNVTINSSATISSKDSVGGGCYMYVSSNGVSHVTNWGTSSCSLDTNHSPNALIASCTTGSGYTPEVIGVNEALCIKN